MKCTPHYHFIDLPNGRRFRTNNDCNVIAGLDDDFDVEELGSGWTIPGKEITRYKGSSDTYRVTTTHVKALRCLLKKKMKVKKGITQQQGKEELLKFCTGFSSVDLNKVNTDDYYAAVVWANLRNNKKLGVNIQRIALMCLPSGLEKFVKKAGSAIGDIAKVALPIAAVVFPVLAPVLAPLAVVANISTAVKAVKGAVDTGKKIKKGVDAVSDEKKKIEAAIKPIANIASTTTGTKSPKVVPQAQIKQAVANVPADITKKVIAGLQQASNKNKAQKQSTDKVAAKVATEVAGKFTPEVTEVLKMLQTKQLQQQATYEHNQINKQNHRDKVQQDIKKQISSLDKKITSSINAKNRAQLTASFFGVPTRLL